MKLDAGDHAKESTEEDSYSGEFTHLLAEGETDL